MTDLGLLQKHVDAADRELRLGYFQRPRELELQALPTERVLAEHDHGWRLFAHALRANVPGCQELRNLQLVVSPSEVRWDAPEFGAYYLHAAADSLAEAGSAHRPSGRSFAERYGRLLSDVASGTAEGEAWRRARAAVEGAARAARAHRELARSIALEWQRFDDRQRAGSSPSSWLSIEEWYDRTGHQRVLAASDDALTARWSIALVLLRPACRDTDAPWLRAIERFRGAEQRLLKVPRAGGERAAELRRVRLYELSGGPAARGEALRQHAAPNVAFTLRDDGATYDYARSAIAGGVGVGFGFFGVACGSERASVDIDTRRPGFRLELSARVESFEVAPGAWFERGAWRSCREGPFVASSAMEQLWRRGGLFGPRGFLGFRPLRVVVVWGAQLRVQLAHAEYHHLKSLAQRSGALYVGPFVAAPDRPDLRSLRFDDRERTFEIRGAGHPPELLAVDHEEL